MRQALFMIGSAAALALARVTLIPGQPAWAQAIGAKPAPRPTPAAPHVAPSPYVIARNPFILDSVAVAGPGRGQVAGVDARLIGIVLGAHPSAIFQEGSGRAQTLGWHDFVGKLRIESITMQGVTLRDGSIIQSTPDSTSYGVDQSVGPTMPPVAPGYSTQQLINGIPAPQFPYQATPLQQTQDNPWGSSPYGSSSTSNPYSTSSGSSNPYQSESSTPHPLLPQ